MFALATAVHGASASAQGSGSFIVERADGRVIDVGESFQDCMTQTENGLFDAAYKSCRDASDYLPLSPGRAFMDDEGRKRSDQKVVYAKAAFGVAGYRIGIRDPRNVTLIMDARREFNEALGLAFEAFSKCDDIVFSLHQNIVNAYNAAGMPNEAYAVSLSAFGLSEECRRTPGAPPPR